MVNFVNMVELQRKVCIVEDNSDLREALGLTISFCDDYTLAGSYGSAEEALKKIPRLKPDAVLMDINLPGESGIFCVSTLKNVFPNMLFLMCTSFEDNDKIFDSLKAGACGYILKTEGPKKILEALKNMIDGGSPMSTSIARKVVARFKEKDIEKPLTETLTIKEKSILDLLAKGFIAREVAEKLVIGKGTMSTHMYNIYKKLQVNTKIEALNLYLKR
jgi:DNA-binding NarL/FixJ family response regulator